MQIASNVPVSKYISDSYQTNGLVVRCGSYSGAGKKKESGLARAEALTSPEVTTEELLVW
jgi:hypothetical protein